MKKIIYTLLLILFFSCSSNIETSKKVPKLNYIPYYLKVYEADSLFLANNYKESFKKLDSLFKKFKRINVLEEQQLYIKSAYLSNQKIDYKKQFKFLIENNSFNKNYFGTNLISILDEYVTPKEYLKWKKKFNDKIIVGLDSLLIEMNIKDQKYRGEKYSSYAFQYKRDSIDEINEEKLINIFNTYGFPNSTNHNKSFKTIVGGILLHTSDSIRMNYFAPKVLEFVKEGACDPMEYATLIDQYYLYNGEKQIYNSYLNDPIKYDTIKTKLLRQEIGLPKSLSINHWINYKTFLMSLDANQIEKNKQMLKMFKKNIYK